MDSPGDLPKDKCRVMPKAGPGGMYTWGGCYHARNDETSAGGRCGRRTGPADWGHRSADIIEYTGIPFDAVPAGSEGALVAELQSAVEREAPLVMMFWSPHWVLSTVDYGWVEFPEDVKEKFVMVNVPVWKMLWPGLKDKWPAAYAVLKDYQLDNHNQEIMMNLIDNEGQDLDAVTKAWVEENRDLWQPWVDQAMAGS